MNMNQEIDVTFYQGGQPPVGAPVAIQAVNDQALIWGYYGCKVTLGAANAISSITIDTCDQNFTYGNVAQTPIQFKVIDSNGNGIPGVPVQVYPSLFPDASKYQGYLIINNQMISSSTPLILYSDSSGLVTVNLSYQCAPSAIGSPYQLPYDAGLWINALQDTIIPVTIHPYNGWFTGGVYIFTGKGGHGITGQGPAAMGPMEPNTVIAQVQGTSIPAAQTLCSCGFNIKML
jgi:hypothetical protein